MKKRISAILVLALCVSLCGCGKSRQVQSVEEAISSLGKISLLSFEAIEEAEKMYDALSYNNNYGLRRGSQPRLFPSQSRSC